MEKEVPARLATLGHPRRLAVFRLLMRRYPDHVPAGELADALGLKPSTLSAYLAALQQAGLVSQARAGTSRRYAVAMPELRRTLDYLLLDCCRGRPDLCALPAPGGGAGRPAVAGGRARVLFLCTGNAARSLLAEALLRREASDRFEVHSAGIRPRAAPDPGALALLRAAGHDVVPLHPKPAALFRRPGAPRFDFVLTVCDRAANAETPAWPGAPLCAHWGVPAPAQAGGDAAAARAALRRAHDLLQARVRAFAELPLASLDRPALQAALDAIGRIDGEAAA